MKGSTLLFFLLTLLNHSFGQNYEDSDSTKYLPLVAYWNNGDVYRYKITKALQNDNTENVLTLNDTNSYVAELEVIDSTATGYTIHWSYLTRSNSPVSPIGNLAISSNDVTDIIYETNDVGAFEGIDNWKEIAIKTLKLYNPLITEQSKGNPRSQDTLKSLMAPFINLYTSKDMIENAVFKEIPVLHNLMGLQFNRDEPFKGEITQPNLFDGNPVRFETTFQLDSIDTTVNFCRFKLIQDANEEDTKAIVNDFLKEIGEGFDTLTEDINQSHFTIHDVQTYDFDYYWGIPLFIETQRDIVFLSPERNRSKTEYLKIELISPPDEDAAQ